MFAPADNGEVRGSGRSIPNLHLRDALDLVSKRHPDLILKFGGHAMAAGLSILEHNIPAFQTAFEEAVREMVCEDDLSQTYITDGQSACPRYYAGTGAEPCPTRLGAGLRAAEFYR